MEFDFEQQIKDRQSYNKLAEDRETFPIDREHCGQCPHLSSTSMTTAIYGAPNYITHYCNSQPCPYMTKNTEDLNA